MLVVGAGGLGSPLALYLAAAGVGTLGLVDFDVVDETNLHRQILFGTPDVGRPKLAAAAERLAGVNPNVRVVPFEERLTSENALRILRDFDVVADGTDNFPTRYLVNDACVLSGKPNVYASVFRFEGQVSVFWAEKGPCYRCLFAEPPPPGLVPSCAEGGVLGILPGLLGTMQATETLKLVLGVGEPLVGRLVLVDALAMRFRELKIRKNPECAVCGPASDRHAADRLRGLLRRAASGIFSRDVRTRSGTHGRGPQGDARAGRRVRPRGRARVARVAHLRPARFREDPAREPCPRASASSRRTTTSSSTAAAARAAPTRCSFWCGRATARRRTSRAASTDGRK